MHKKTASGRNLDDILADLLIKEFLTEGEAYIILPVF